MRERYMIFGKTRVVMMSVALLLVAGLIGWLIFKQFNEQRINRGEYQAVYLVSGQIYFGKLQNTDGDYLTLTDIYLAQSNDTSSTDGSTTVQPTKTDLVKATDQIYGPENSMAIRASQVQFWQNLRSDSKVSKAIDAATK